MKLTHLLDLPLLRVRDLGESLALQGVVLLQLGSVAQVEVGWPVRIPHGGLLLRACVPPPVRVQVLARLLVHVLDGRRVEWGDSIYFFKV